MWITLPSNEHLRLSQAGPGYGNRLFAVSKEAMMKSQKESWSCVGQLLRKVRHAELFNRAFEIARAFEREYQRALVIHL